MVGGDAAGDAQRTRAAGLARAADGLQGGGAGDMADVQRAAEPGGARELDLVPSASRISTLVPPNPPNFPSGSEALMVLAMTQSGLPRPLGEVPSTSYSAR